MQLPLSLDGQVLPDLDTLAGPQADAVRAAVANLLAVPGSRLMLAGVRGAGKSHALAASCRAAAEHGLRAALVPLADPQFADARALDDVWQCDLVCIDDIQVIAGDRAREVALFNCYNECEAHGTRLLLGARATPGELRLSLPDLTSRLTACVVLQMTPLDDDALARMLEARAHALGFALPAAASDYLLQRVSRDPHDLERMLARIADLSLSEKKPVTVAAVRGWLKAGALAEP